MLKQHTKPVAAILAALVCWAVLPGWLGWRIAPVAAANRPQSMGHGTVYIDRQTSMDPVSIEKITVGGQLVHAGVMNASGHELEPGTQFQANEDWLKNMSIVLKNRTDKIIVRAEIELWFPDAGDGSSPSRPRTPYNIQLGQLPEIDSFTGRGGRKLQPQPDKQPLWLAPGKALVIQVADYIDRIQDMLEQFPGALGSNQPLSRVTRVTIRQIAFYFVDGMRWTDLYGFGVPDTNHPSQFTNLDRGHYFPGNPSQNWPPTDAPGEARFPLQP